MRQVCVLYFKQSKPFKGLVTSDIFCTVFEILEENSLPLPGIQGLELFHNSSGSGHSTDDIGSGDDTPETDSDQMDEDAGSVTLQYETAASLLEEGALEHDENTSGAISSLLQDIAGIEVNEIDTVAGFEPVDVVDRTTELPVDSLGRDILGEPGMGNRVHDFYPSCLGFSLLIYKLYLMFLLPVPQLSLIKQSFFFFLFSFIYWLVWQLAILIIAFVCS